MKFVVAAALALNVAVPAAAAAQIPGAEVGRPAPAFHLTTLDGRTVSLETYRGKTLVINVWGSWCPPCRMETPDLIAESALGKRDGVAFLGVDSTEPATAVRAFVAAKGIPYPQAVVTGESAFVRAYAITNYPTTIVIDPHGIVRALHADNVLPRPQLHAYIVAAQQGRTTPLVSEQQRQLDDLLAEKHYSFDGGEDEIGTNARNAAQAIDKAEDLMDQTMSDPSRDHDLLKTHDEEMRLRAAAIAGLTRIAKSKEDAALLARLRGDQALAEQHWRDADAAYAEALADKIAQLSPSYSTYIAVARTRARLHERDAAYVALDKAIALAKEPPRLAWTHLYGGRSALALGDVGRARKEFAEAAIAAADIPAENGQHAMYLEEAQEGSIAAGIAGHGTAISLAPWTGADLPGSIASTLKYRLAVAGTAGAHVALHASGLPKGWVASFCSDRLCRPFNADIEIPAVGVKIVEFQIVPGDGPAPATVRIDAALGGKIVASALAPAHP